jgi:hypothetical protein
VTAGKTTEHPNDRIVILFCHGEPSGMEDPRWGLF